MKNKLKLAIASIILPFIFFNLQHLFPDLMYSGDGFSAGFRDSISFLISLCSLGVLPFFVSLYKSKEFNELIDKEEAEVNSKDDSWIKHFLLRIGIILGICLALFSISFFSSGMDTAYLIMYGIAGTIGVSFIILIVEAVLLARKKLWNKFYTNIAMIGVLFFFGMNLL